MNRYLYNNMKFTQEDIELAAKDHGVELIDYLSDNPDIELIEGEGNGDDEKEEKEKPTRKSFFKKKRTNLSGNFVKSDGTGPDNVDLTNLRIHGTTYPKYEAEQPEPYQRLILDPVTKTFIDQGPNPLTGGYGSLDESSHNVSAWKTDEEEIIKDPLISDLEFENSRVQNAYAQNPHLYKIEKSEIINDDGEPEIVLELKPRKHRLKKLSLATDIRNEIIGDEIKSLLLEPTTSENDEGEIVIDDPAIAVNSDKYIQPNPTIQSTNAFDVKHGTYVKYNVDGVDKYYNINDILEGDLLNKLSDPKIGWDYDALDAALGDDMEIVTFDEPTITTWDLTDDPLPEFVIEEKIDDYAKWRNSTLKNMHWEKGYWDNIDWAQVFNDEENQAVYTLDFLLPTGFTTEQYKPMYDQVKVIAPNGDFTIIQFDYDKNKPNDSLGIYLQQDKLKNFVKRNQYSPENLLGWKWFDWKDKLTKQDQEWVNLVNTPANEGGIGVTKEEQKIIWDYASNYFMQRTAAVSLGGLAIASDGSTGITSDQKEEMAPIWHQAFQITNLQRKQEGQPEFAPIGTGGQKQNLVFFDRNGIAYPYYVDGGFNKKDWDAHGEKYVSSPTHGVNAFNIGMSAEAYNATVATAQQLIRIQKEGEFITNHVEEWQESQDSWYNFFARSDSDNERAGFGIASGVTADAVSKYLQEAALNQTSATKALYLDQQQYYQNMPFKREVLNFFSENAFANVILYDPSLEGTARYENIEAINKTPGALEMVVTPYMPGNLGMSAFITQSEGGILDNETGTVLAEDTYVKIQGGLDPDNPNEIFLYKQGEPVLEENGGFIIKNGMGQATTIDGKAVMFMPSSVVMNFNTRKTALVATEKMFYDNLNQALDFSQQTESWDEYLEAFDKSFNEFENLSVGLGIAGIRTAKDIVYGAILLTSYVNPVYWTGKMMGVDMLENLAETNVELQNWLDAERARYDMHMTEFKDIDSPGGFGEWLGTSFVNTAPIMVAMILSGGSSSYATLITSGIAGLSSAGGKATEIDLHNDAITQQISKVVHGEDEYASYSKEEKEIKIEELRQQQVSQGQKWLDSAFSGANEFTFAWLTTAPFLNNLSKQLKGLNPKVTSEIYTSIGQKMMANVDDYIKELGGETIGEVGVQFFQNLYDGVPPTTGLAEAAAAGFAISLLMKGGVDGISYRGAATHNYWDNSQIKEAQKIQSEIQSNYRAKDNLQAEIDVLIDQAITPDGRIDRTKDIKINELKAKQNALQESINLLESQQSNLTLEVEKNLRNNGMRKIPAIIFSKNIKKMSELRVEAENLLADPTINDKNSAAYKRFMEIEALYKKIQTHNEHFKNNENFGHEWFALKGEAEYNGETQLKVKDIETQAIQKIRDDLGKPDYQPDQSEINAAAVEIIDGNTFDANVQKAKTIADNGGWEYYNSETKEEAVEQAEKSYTEYIESLSDTEKNELVKVRDVDGNEIFVTREIAIELKKKNVIEAINDGSLNGYFDEDLNTQFTVKENAVSNQKTGVPLHETAHGATKKIIASDPDGFKKSSDVLVSFLSTQYPDLFAAMQVEGTNNLRNEDGSDWDFEEVFSAFVEEVANEKIDLDLFKEFSVIFGYALNNDLQTVSKGEFEIDFKGANDIIAFMTTLGAEIGMGDVNAETFAELQARAEDQTAEDTTPVIPIEEEIEVEPAIAASQTVEAAETQPTASQTVETVETQPTASKTKTELINEANQLLKDKPPGWKNKVAKIQEKVRKIISDAATNQGGNKRAATKKQNEPATVVAQKAKTKINDAVNEVRTEIPTWTEGSRQKPNPVMDKLHNTLDSELDAMIKAKAERFVTNDKNVVDLTQNVDLAELQQAVKLELLADFRGFNKTNDSLYGYINSRLKQRIGDVLPELWTDMSQKDIDNLSTTDTKTINETKPLIESVPDTKLQDSLKMGRETPIGKTVLDTVKKVLNTKMPEFKYVRKNKGGKRTDVSLAEVKKVLETNPTGETKRQAERDLAGIYKQFTGELEATYASQLRDSFIKTFGTRDGYTNWIKDNAPAISDMSIDKLVALERLVKPKDRIFTEVVKENLSVEEVKQLEGTGLLVSGTTNQGPTLYKKLRPDSKKVEEFFNVKGSKKGTRKDALADKLSGEMALNATMEIASDPSVREKFELGLKDSGTGETVVDAYLEDVSKAIDRGAELKYSRSFMESSASLDLKNTYQNNRKTFVDKLREYGVNPDGVDQAWLDAFDGSLFTTTTEGKKWAKKLKKEWSALSSEMQQVEEILTDRIQLDILNSIIDQEAGDLNDTERAELIAKAKQEAATTKRGLDFDDIVQQLAKNLGIKKGYAYEQFVYDATERAIEQWNKENGKESALKLEGIRGEEGGKADFIATIGGNAFNVELKLGNARFGSVTVNTTTNSKGDISFNIKKDYSFNKDFLKAVEQAKKDIKAWTKRANDIGRKEFGDNWLDYKFGDILEKKVFFQLQAEGLQKNITRTWVTDTGAIAEIYWNKENGTAYINIEGKGLYKFRNPKDPELENPANLDDDSVPYFDGTVTWSFAIAKTTAHSKGGPTKYRDAGIKLVDGKLPGSEGWVNTGLRMQPSNIKGLPEAKIDMSSIQGIMDLQNMPAVNQGLDVEKGKSSQSNIDNNGVSEVVTMPSPSKTTNPDTIRQAEILDKALSIARDPNAPVKKIRVFDFDDTLARTNSNVLYSMPDGTTGKLTAEEFAKKGDEMQADGAVWDFSEFNKVVDGKKGPLFRVAQKIQEARGTDDVFVLTARSADAAPAIQEFLSSIGLDIPIENITGLGDSSPLAKSGWMVDKAAEGYNDFYFADDHLGNVDAVDKAMSVIDVKSKTQQAKLKFSRTVPEVMNDIIFDKTGIESYKEYSSMRAKAKGRKKRSWSLIAPSAQDFGGLLYKLLAKGEKGNAQWEWMQENLIKPFSRGMNDLSVAQNQLMRDFRALKNSLKGIPTNLKKQAFGGFTYEDITRIAAWTKQGIKVDGLSKRDLKQIMDFVEGMPEINLFVDQLIELGKGDGYHYPGGDWLAGTITTDFMSGLKTTTRPRLLKQWIENIDLAFDEKTLNKLEAAFGPKYREAIEDSIRRMKTGQNRKQGMSRLEQRFQDYINNSVGAVMFLNARSAVLQTISAINFVNWTDNNPLKAGKAFANQKQYWTDFMSLMNSDFLVDRRNGLKINVSESEIAEAAKTTGNSVKGVISFLLNKGFVLTQIADSFAIASGGATFYRNRVNTYIKQGMSKADAEAKAFLDFRDTAEESQQSARADKISQQQASTLGRVILAFANTPSQYTRIMDKAGRDLMAGRGDWKNNLSKIAYYGFVQNLMFTALQSALFAVGFGEDEEEIDEKTLETANSMLDNIMRGAGVQGVILSTVKNAILDLYERNKLEGSWPGPEYSESVWKLLEVSPPLSIKAKKYKSGMKDYELNSWRPEAKEPFNINNPSYRAAAKVIAALTNVPVDRLFQKMENVQGAMDGNNEAWQRVMMLMGWPKWQLENQIQKDERYAKEKQGRKEYRQHVKDSQTRKYTYKPLPTKAEYKQQELEKQKKVLFELNKSEQLDSLRSLGLTTDAIKRLKYEEDRVNKIIELSK